MGAYIIWGIKMFVHLANHQREQSLLAPPPWDQDSCPAVVGRVGAGELDRPGGNTRYITGFVLRFVSHIILHLKYLRYVSTECQSPKRRKKAPGRTWPAKVPILQAVSPEKSLSVYPANVARVKSIFILGTKHISYTYCVKYERPLCIIV